MLSNQLSVYNDQFFNIKYPVLKKWKYNFLLFFHILLSGSFE